MKSLGRKIFMMLGGGLLAVAVIYLAGHFTGSKVVGSVKNIIGGGQA